MIKKWRPRFISQHEVLSQGAVTLMMTVILLTFATLVIIYAANFAIMEQKTTANQVYDDQAFEAAEAGLEYGISYLITNSSTILASPTGGYINAISNSNITNVTLANQAKFSIVYSNPTANNYSVIKVQSTGTNSDGTATHVLSQLIAIKSVLSNTPSSSLSAQGSVTMTDNAIITNTNNPLTIKSGSLVLLFSNAETVLSTGVSSTPFNLKSDIQSNQSSISSLSQSDYFASIFGLGSSTIKGLANYSYSNSSNHDYSNQLNNLNNAIIWIDQSTGTTATIQNNISLGTATNPVILIANGQLLLQSNVTINGYVFVNGASTTIKDGVVIHGGLGSSSTVLFQNNAHLYYDSSVLANLGNQTNTEMFAKIPGSWKDF